jgi:hypothetical protein
MSVANMNADLWVLEYLLDVEALDDGLIQFFSDRLVCGVNGARVILCRSLVHSVVPELQAAPFEASERLQVLRK